MFRNRSRQRACWIALLLLVPGTGCTRWPEYVHNGFKVGPNYAPPDAPVAEHWIDAADQRVRSESDNHTLTRWWAVFRDPALDELIQAAQRQNLTLREAGLRILQAREQLAIVRGELFPQTQVATASYRHTQNPLTSPNPFLDTWDRGFSLAWELDFWGRFRRAILAADADLDRSVADYDDVLVTLLADVATNYVQLRVAEQQIVVARDNVRLQGLAYDATQEKFRQGVEGITPIDPSQAESNLRRTQSQIPFLEISRRQANNRLCILLGLPPVELRDQFEAWRNLDRRKADHLQKLDDLMSIKEKLVLLAEEGALGIAELREVGRQARIEELTKLTQADEAPRGIALLKAAFLQRLGELRNIERSTWQAAELGQSAEDAAIRDELKRTDELLARHDPDTIPALVDTVDSWRRKLTVYVPTVPTSVVVGIPAELLSRRPDVRRAERDVAAQSERIGIAMTDLYPAISINGDLGYTASQFPDLFTSQAFKGSVGPSFRWNLLNYGRLLHNVRLQDAKLQELVVRYQETVLRAGGEVEDSLITFLRSQEQVELLRQSVRASQVATVTAMLLWARGQKGFDFNRLSTVQLDLVQRQEALVLAQGQIAQALIQTYRGLGGGWQNRPDQTLPGAVRPEGEFIDLGRGENILPRPVPAPAPLRE